LVAGFVRKDKEMERNKFWVFGIWVVFIIWVTEYSPLFACWGMCEERGNWGFLSVLTLLVKGNDCSLLGCWEIVRKKNKFGLVESLFFSALLLAV
jgi:hypothetical protein